MVFVMGFSFGIMVWLPMILGGRAQSRDQLSSHFLTVVCVYALTLLGQVSYWNCFGFDRSATQIFFAAPQPLSRTLLGKNIASLVFIYMEVFILAGVRDLPRELRRRAIRPRRFGHRRLLALHARDETSPVCNTPGRSTPSASPRRASSRFQPLVFLLYPFSLLPVFSPTWRAMRSHSELMFYLVLALAAMIGSAVYWIAMESAVSTALERREKIIQALSPGRTADRGRLSCLCGQGDGSKEYNKT